MAGGGTTTTVAAATATCEPVTVVIPEEAHKDMLSVSGKKKCSFCNDELGNNKKKTYFHFVFILIRCIFVSPPHQDVERPWSLRVCDCSIIWTVSSAACAACNWATAFPEPTYECAIKNSTVRIAFPVMMASNLVVFSS